LFELFHNNQKESSMNFQDFIPFYDFSVIEAAIQKLFCTVDGSFFETPLGETDNARKDWTPQVGNVAFYTVANQLVFQECRPRVAIRLKSVHAMANAYDVDALNTVRGFGWHGIVDFSVVTEMNYAFHSQLRAAVAAIVPQVMPQIVADNSLFSTTGINALLTNFQVSKFFTLDLSTEPNVTQGFYGTVIPVEMEFSTPTRLWPTN